MRAITIAIVMTALAAASASAQVINGESTYGDSDLHQPPAETRSPPAEAKDAERTRQPDAPQRR